MAKPSVASHVETIVRPVVESLGYDLWDVEFVKLGADWNLTIVIDNEAGITIDDCEIVHRAVDPVLDEHDPIETPYILNVSSTGIERELKRDAHILASLGERCEAKLFAPLNGKKSYKGILASYEDGVVTLETEDGVLALPRTSISKLKTVYFD